MVITVLEATVQEENWTALKNNYQTQITDLPPQMVQTFLLQNTKNPRLWQIISVWKDRAALDEMRRATETPTGVLMFRAVNAEPALSIFDVPAFAP